MTDVHYHATRHGTGGPWVSDPYPSRAQAILELEQAASLAVAAAADSDADWAGGEPTSRHGWLVRWQDDGGAAEQVYEWIPCLEEHDPLITVRAEVFAFTADPELGIWHVPGTEPWVSEDLRASCGWLDTTNAILAEHGIDEAAAAVLHSTSWRPDQTWMLLTIGVALNCPDVLDHWPAAVPVSPKLLEQEGPPATHAANKEPVVRDFDVACHVLRHFQHLVLFSRTEAKAFSPAWRKHLKAWKPALAGLYDREHPPAELDIAS